MQLQMILYHFYLYGYIRGGSHLKNSCLSAWLQIIYLSRALKRTDSNPGYGFPDQPSEVGLKSTGTYSGFGAFIRMISEIQFKNWILGVFF